MSVICIFGVSFPLTCFLCFVLLLSCCTGILALVFYQNCSVLERWQPHLNSLSTALFEFSLAIDAVGQCMNQQSCHPVFFFITFAVFQLQQHRERFYVDQFYIHLLSDHQRFLFVKHPSRILNTQHALPGNVTLAVCASTGLVDLKLTLTRIQLYWAASQQILPSLTQVIIQILYVLLIEIINSLTLPPFITSGIH